MTPEHFDGYLIHDTPLGPAIRFKGGKIMQSGRIVDGRTVPSGRYMLVMPSRHDPESRRLRSLLANIGRWTEDDGGGDYRLTFAADDFHLIAEIVQPFKADYVGNYNI